MDIKKNRFMPEKTWKNEEALEYYLQASDMEPENIHTAIMVAHCYLDLKDYDNSLKYYFRIEYREPGNLKILRPIAFCYFALGRFDDSEKYYDRLSESKLTSHDLINKGHLALCKGNKKEAIDLYRLSIIGGEISKDQFMSVFSEDSSLLISLGVNQDDLPILIDYLLFTIG